VGEEEIEWPSDGKKSKAKVSHALKKQENEKTVIDEDEAECEDDDEMEGDNDDDDDENDDTAVLRLSNALEYVLQHVRHEDIPACEDDEINDTINEYSLAEREEAVVTDTPEPEPETELVVMHPQPQTTACSAPNSPLPAFPRSPVLVATLEPIVAMVLSENAYGL
jgi:hypothetical protein